MINSDVENCLFMWLILNYAIIIKNMSMTITLPCFHDTISLQKSTLHPFNHLEININLCSIKITRRNLVWTKLKLMFPCNFVFVCAHFVNNHSATLIWNRIFNNLQEGTRKRKQFSENFKINFSHHINEVKWY